MKKSRLLVPLLTALIIALTGCGDVATDSSQPGNEKTSAKDNTDKAVAMEPATITFLVSKSNEGFFRDFVEKVVKAKYPQITLKAIVANSTSSELNKRIAANEELPDIIGESPGGMGPLQDMNALIDLNPYIKKYNFDLGRLNPQLVAAVKGYSSKGEFFVLPYTVEAAVLYYNKDLFDKFGVPYPKDGLTWDETIEIARKMSRIDSGTNYRGFDVQVGYFFNNNPLSVNYYDAGTGKPNIGDSRWDRLMKLLKQFNDIPNNHIDSSLINQALTIAFVKNRTLAMTINPLNAMESQVNSGATKGLNWDAAAVPSFPEIPKTGLQMNYNFYGITPTSKVKDAAFQVISFLLTDENGKGMARVGKEPALTGKAFQDEFGKDVDFLQGKHVAAFTYDQLAPRAAASEYDKAINTELQTAYKDIMLNGKDVNSALREAQGRAEQKVSEMKQ